MAKCVQEKVPVSTDPVQYRCVNCGFCWLEKGSVPECRGEQIVNPVSTETNGVEEKVKCSVETILIYDPTTGIAAKKSLKSVGSFFYGETQFELLVIPSNSNDRAKLAEKTDYGFRLCEGNVLPKQNAEKSNQSFQCPDCMADLEVKLVKHNS